MGQESDLLFRQEVLDEQRASSSQFGTPTGVLPPAWSRITLLLAIFIAALIMFLMNVDFSRKETVRGKLRAEGAEAKIYALETGVIKHVFVEDGAIVQEGDPIAEIVSERFMAGGAEISEQTIKSLRAERASLEERRASIQRAASIAIEEANQRIAEAARQETETQNMLAVVERRLEIAQKRAQDAEEFLAEGLIAEPQYNERLDAVSVIEQSTLQTRARIEEARSAQSRYGLERRRINENLQRDLSDLKQGLSKINSQIDHAQASAGHIIQATMSGRVTALQAKAGERADPSIPMATILPEDGGLIAELYLPSRAIAFVETGQEVKLQYDAFPYQKFGVAKGEVIEIAETALFPQEIGVMTQNPEPLYRVLTKLEQPTVEAYGKDVPLQSGMELTANIVLENRALIEWVLEPVLRRLPS